MAQRRSRAEAVGGAIAGAFTITNTMTSLTGASGEDFASILRSLGYWMDRRPKPPEPAPPLAEQQALAVASADDGDRPGRGRHA